MQYIVRMAESPHSREDDAAEERVGETGEREEVCVRLQWGSCEGFSNVHRREVLTHR